jgi:hypothetical protein
MHCRVGNVLRQTDRRRERQKVRARARAREREGEKRESTRNDIPQKQRVAREGMVSAHSSFSS